MSAAQPLSEARQLAKDCDIEDVFERRCRAELIRLDAESEQLRTSLLAMHDTLEMTARAGAAYARSATELQAAVKRLHAAKGRHHTQLAACDLFDLCGFKNERPTK